MTTRARSRAATKTGEVIELGSRKAAPSVGTGSAGQPAGAGPIADSPARGPRGAGQYACEGFVLWWNGDFVLTVAATVGLAVAEVHNTVRLGTLLALYACLSLLYAFTLGRWVGSGGGSKRSGLFYLAGAFAIYTAACFLFPGSALLLFILVPHCFLLLSFRPAIMAILGLVLVNAGAVLAYNGINVATVVAISVSGGLTLPLSIFLGAYIDSIIGQSRQRALLIEELERTRGELAEVSHEKGALAERERLVREIHDALAQGFTSVIILLQAAQATLERGEHGDARRQLSRPRGPPGTAFRRPVRSSRRSGRYHSRRTRWPGQWRGFATI